MFANFPRYTRFIARRERVTSPIWIAALCAFTAALAAAYPRLFPTPEALSAMAATLSTPAMAALMGPVYGPGALNTSMVMAQQCQIWLALAVILMNIFFVNRHTRADEELGRSEMLAALPVGRLTGSLSALVSAFLLDLGISLLSAGLLLLIHIDGTTAAGAFAYSFSIGAQGFVFAALTLLTAQLFSTAAGSAGASFALLGALYILRAVGDMRGSVLSDISPLGLGLKAEAFYQNAFWPVLTLLAEALAVGGVSLLVGAGRDVGAGILPARRGRTRASRALGTPLGLAWRLCRGTLFAWAVGLFALGAAYGAVVGDIGRFAQGNGLVQKMIESAGGSSMTESFITMLNAIMGMLISVPLIATMNRLRTEERRGRLEQILARAVSRTGVYLSYLLVAVAAALVFPFLVTFGLYAAGASTGLLSLPPLLKAAYAYLPAQLCMVGLSAFLIGWLPRLAGLSWAVFAYSFAAVYFGGVFGMPRALIKLSPFGGVPELPAQNFTAAPLIVLCAIAAALAAAGAMGYRRRDIAAV